MNNLHNLQCLLSSGIGSPSRVVRFLKLNRHSNSVNNPNGSLINQVVIRPQRSSFVTVRPSHSPLAEQQLSIPKQSTKTSSTSLRDFAGSKRSFSSFSSNSSNSSRSARFTASSHLLSSSSSVQRSVTCSQSSSMAPIIVNYQSYLEKLISDTRVLIFSKSTCPFCLKVSLFSVHRFSLISRSPLSPP